MYSDGDDPKGPGFPIRISTDKSSFAAPHGFSQRTTSFIASRCQGIHQTPLRRLIDPTSNGQRPMLRLSTGSPAAAPNAGPRQHFVRSEEHTSELQSLMRNSYAVFCLKKKKKNKHE